MDPETLIAAARQAPSDAPLEAIRRSIDAARDRPPTVRDRVRELSSPLRVMLALTGGGVIAAMCLMLEGGREDLSAAGAQRLMGATVVAAGLGALGVGVSLRGAWSRAGGRVAAMIVVLLALPAVVALLPPGFEVRTPGLIGGWAEHVACGIASVMVAALVAGVVLWVERSDRPGPDRLLAAAAVGGIAGWLVQSWHCMVAGPIHLVLGHSAAGVVIALVLHTRAKLRG